MSKYDKYPIGKEVTYHTIVNGELKVRTGMIEELRNITLDGSIKMYVMTNGERAQYSEIEKGNVRHERRKL